MSASRLPPFRRAFVFFVALTALGPSGCAEELDDPEAGVQAPAPELSPSLKALRFGLVELGASQVRHLRLANTGETELALSRVTLEGPQPESFLIRGRDGAPWDDAPIHIAPGSASELEVVYAPREIGSAAASLCFESNDPDTPRTCVSLLGDETGPRLEVTPARVDFGAVAPGEQARATVTVTNVGSAELVFLGDDPSTGVSLSGSDDFAPGKGSAESVLYPGLGTPLLPGESFELTLWYRPPDAGVDHGRLSFLYDFGGEARELVVGLAGNKPTTAEEEEEARYFRLLFP